MDLLSSVRAYFLLFTIFLDKLVLIYLSNAYTFLAWSLLIFEYELYLLVENNLPIMTVLSINRDDQVDKWLKETQALSAFIAETLKSPNLAALEECKKELETVLYGTRMSAGDLTVNLETQFDPVAEVKKRDEELRQKLPVVEQMIKIQTC
jgi:type II secretory pathway component PulF